MYVTVLEALSLQRGQSFLNVGSGSGYLSCLAASLLGPNGVSHGIEISESNVSFSLQAIQKWKEKNPDLYSKQEVVSIIHGNCFDIDVAASADCCKYDRIYVGAGCPEGRKEFFYHLLSINGILVMPIDERNQLIKVLKLSPTLYSTAHVSYVHFAPLIEASFHDDELMAVHNNDSNSESIPIVDQNLLGLLHNVDLSTVSHFKSPVPKAGRNKVMLPTLLWAPEKYRHLQFPTDFRHVVKMVLIAANRWLPELPVTSSSQNAATKRASCSTLPVAIWFVVFTFASR